MPFIVHFQGLVWGVGDTQDAAIQDARQCLLQDGPDERTERRLSAARYGTAFRTDDETVYCVPATERLVERVRADGPVLWITDADGRADLAVSELV